MKNLILSLLFLMISSFAFAQPTINLGIKAGINSSKIDLKGYDSESVIKSHVGAFGRIGWGRLYVQPEVYYSAKGGDLNETALSIDFSTVDVPVLLGFQLLKRGGLDLHANVGPVFSFITSSDLNGDFNEEDLSDNYVGIQYGLGVDIWLLTFDVRMEQSGDNLFEAPNFDGKNQMFIFSVGFKFL